VDAGDPKRGASSDASITRSCCKRAPAIFDKAGGIEQGVTNCVRVRLIAMNAATVGDC